MIPQSLACFLFENSPFDPALTALLVGFAEIGFDGIIRRTDAGEEYLKGIEQ